MTAPATLRRSALAPSAAPVQTGVVVASLALLAVLAVPALAQGGMRQLALMCVGFVAGIALFHASFGFTSAWRNLLKDRRSHGVRAQLAMIAFAVAVFFPALAGGSLFGQSVEGFVNPVGLALVMGAFVFGMGMQLGGGCGSGTLYVAGGGSARMVVTLAGFVGGSFAATANPFGWLDWPRIEGISLVRLAGAPLALVIAVALLALVHRVVSHIETARHGAVRSLSDHTPTSLLHGPWPILGGAFALALVNIATLALAGRPWGITSAFALWGAKMAAATGVPVDTWTYWQGSDAISASLFSDVTSVMNFGIMLGALGAAGLAGRYAPFFRVPVRSLAAALLGGLMMGVGARLATGCNIGAFFSGLSSGSLHSVVWLFAALAGNAVGIRWRPAFGLGS